MSTQIQYILYCLLYFLNRDSSPICCSGWGQNGDECTVSLCEGERACLQDEVCVYPGLCRCKPGFYGYQCKTPCPPEFWGPDCRELCPCHPHGLCDPVTGECSCLPNRWGKLCQNSCKCGRHGKCDPVYGNCTCEEGWWTSTCSKACQCHLATSTCDQATGRCLCDEGYWGQKCSLRCNCYVSPCQQRTGACQCQHGWWGPSCDRRCICNLRGRSCSKQDGLCDACAPGWNGTRCDQPCPAGYYGHRCQEVCLRCRNMDPCDTETGACLHCDPGWNGTRCEQPCPAGYYGHRCQEVCLRCRNMDPCDTETGACLHCDPGWTGPSRAGLLAGLLIPLCILILALLFCCCCCGRPIEGKEGPAVRMKHHVYTVLANMGSAMPCITLWSSGLPRVTVSHHDPELTFNHSFIEQPSSSWVTDSFETDDEGEAVYCEPPREGTTVIFLLQELSSKCNFFPDPSTFSSDDMSQDFGIPRTSSIAKSKRPSVSFAEGTKFSPKECRNLTQDLPGTSRKPKAWGVLMISALQGGQGNHSETETEKEEKNHEETISSEEQAAASETTQTDSERYSSGPLRTHLTVPSGRRCTLSNTRKNAQPSDSGQDTDSEKLTTVYVTVGKTQKMAKQEPPSEGPVQAMLRRLGSLQRQREEAAQPKGRGQAIAKPPRRKLGARASAWEQATGSNQSEVVMRKPSRRKHNSLSSPCTVGATDFPQENCTPKRPLSSILKSVPESDTLHSLEVEQDTGVVCDTDTLTEHTYETVAPSDGVSTSSEIIINETVVDQAENEPNYENVYVKHS
uniref:Scavenger receptor class F member 1-like n=1 Tax=Sinocyclocheilus rhinocerous TaxID=307959 RepID=A0A673J4N7_9TELE